MDVDSILLSDVKYGIFHIDNIIPLWYNDSMTHSSTKNSKSILARALATENIRVEHSPSVHTAMFDVANRVLILPVWENMSDELYDMFVGHEVGHALFTPFKDEKVDGPWCADAQRIGGNVHASYVQGILNVVEDARIERKMKDKYPGLRRDFATGYRDLIDRDFFGTKDKDINKFSFVDRLNIHFKCGFAMNIQFNEDEQKIVDAMTTTESFDDVVKVSEEIFTYINGQHENHTKEQNENSVPVKFEDLNGDGELANVIVDVPSSDESTPSNSALNQKNGVDEKKKETENTKTQSSGNEGGRGLAPESLLPPVTTQNTFDNKIKKEMINKNTSSVSYTTLGVPDISRIVLPWQKSSAILNNHFTHMTNHRANSKMMANVNSMFNDLVQNTKPLINTLVKQFEMKKAADVSKRTSVSRTGKINTDRIFKYKVSDDIFLRCAKIAEGKNHGLVMYVDWSSSMQFSTNDVINQVIILTQFCRRMNIPFDVYLFSSQYTVLSNHIGISNGDSPYTTDYKQWKKQTNSHVNTRNCVGSASMQYSDDGDIFALIQVLSSDMSGRQFNEALRSLFTLGMMINPTNDVFRGLDPEVSRHVRRSVPDGFTQGNTPLDATIIASMYMIPEFQKKHKIQIVNTIFLTDGETGWRACATYSSGTSSYGPQNYLRCPINNREYKCDHVTSTDLLLEVLADVTGCTTIGFFIQSKNTKYCRYYNEDNRDEDYQSFKDNGFFDAPHKKKIKTDIYTSNPRFIEVKNHGYDRLFVLPSKMEITDGMDELDSLSSSATLTRIRNTFTKTVEKRNSSRTFLNRFADVIAVETKR